MNKEILSVRTRRKLETIAIIHETAQKLALQHGLSNAKVEDIAAAAGISKRTFFNYFATKEDAVLGLQSPSLPDGAVERFNASADDVLTRTALLVLEVTRSTIVPGSTLKQRKALRQRFPELYSRFEFLAISAETIVRPVLSEHLSKEDPGATEQDVNVMLRLAGTIIRYTYTIDPEIKDESINTSIAAFKTVARKTL